MCYWSSRSSKRDGTWSGTIYLLSLHPLVQPMRSPGSGTGRPLTGGLPVNVSSAECKRNMPSLTSRNWLAQARASLWAQPYQPQPARADQGLAGALTNSRTIVVVVTPATTRLCYSIGRIRIQTCLLPLLFVFCTMGPDGTLSLLTSAYTYRFTCHVTVYRMDPQYKNLRFTPVISGHVYRIVAVLDSRSFFSVLTLI